MIHSHPDCIEALAREQQDLILVQNNRHQIPLNILNSNECGNSRLYSVIPRIVHG